VTRICSIASAHVCVFGRHTLSVESLEMAWEESGLRFGFLLLRLAERDPRAVMMVLDLTCTEITARFHTQHPPTLAPCAHTEHHLNTGTVVCV
jgi:hypothetical protein